MSGESVLIIDDNLMNLKLERLLLEIEQCQVKTARSAKEALDVLRDFLPQVILMDLQLPGTDGLELTRQLKAAPRYKNIPVILVTSYSQKGEEELARAAGCSEYIRKPIDTQSLPRIIRKYLGRE